jgi:predicted MFS family arabinose efflux permease
MAPLNTPEQRSAATTSARFSAWAPLKHHVFGVLWGATLVSNIGTWVHEVGAGWLMTQLAPSPAMVALVQTATMLPVFLFSLPAGAVADMLDRRRLLIGIQCTMLALAAALGLIVVRGEATPLTLLLFTFALGTCSAATSPTWNSVVPKLVPKEDFPAAVALNAVAINLSRAIGPVIGGAAIGALGIASPFLLNAVSFLGVIVALLWWRPEPTPPRAEAGGIASAMRAGLRYVFASAPLKATLIRSIGFFLFACAYWSLLPLIAREQLGGGAQLYGLLVTCIGGGAVFGAQFLPQLRRSIGADRLVVAGTLGTAAALFTFGTTSSPAIAALGALVAGAAWITAISTFSVSTQLLLPDAMRARGLAVYNTLFYGSLALGSVCWGQVAEYAGLDAALFAAAAGILISMGATWRYRLGA